jgi:spore germination protein YaaH
VPLNRIALGVPTYGYDWRSGAHGVSLQWADVNALARAHRATPKWDTASSSPWLRYRDDHGREHTVWYENARSLGVKLDLARRAGVTRIVLWRLGGEDPAIWPVLRGQR